MSLHPRLCPTAQDTKDPTPRSSCWRHGAQHPRSNGHAWQLPELVIKPQDKGSPAAHSRGGTQLSWSACLEHEALGLSMNTTYLPGWVVPTCGPRTLEAEAEGLEAQVILSCVMTLRLAHATSGSPVLAPPPPPLSCLPPALI